MNTLISDKNNQLLKAPNNFDFIRYFFAFSLVIVHFCTLMGIDQFWVISGGLRVKVFFIMSGFLIFYSYIKNPNLKNYIRKRTKRIFPPYLLVVILCFIIGIFITNLRITEYLQSKESYSYLINNILFLNFLQPTLPGVFENNPIQAVNGSLWTMKVEIMFYISVPIVFYLLKKYNKLWVMIGIFVFSILYEQCFTYLFEKTNNELYFFIRKQIGSQFIYFYSGTFILLYFQYFRKYLKYLFPLFAFALGVLIAEQIQNKYKYARRLHWRQGILGAEILILFVVGFIPQRGNMIATVLVSFACAMQVQSFRKVNGFSYASTMCIGNLRSGTAALSVYFREKKSKQLKQAMYYFGIILMFALGAGIGGNLSIRYGIRMIWVSCGFLMISFLLMFIEKYKHFHEEHEIK